MMMMMFYRHNGSLANGDKGRRRSRLALYKRPKANGVRPDVIHNVSTPLVSKVTNSNTLMSYWFRRGHTLKHEKYFDLYVKFCMVKFGGGGDVDVHLVC